MATTAEDQRLASEIASAAATLYNAILETVSVGIFTLEADGTIVYANAEAGRLWGLEPSELAGNNIRLLLPSIGSGGNGGSVIPALSGRTLDVVGADRQGHRVPLALTVRETPVGDRLLYTAALHDISDRLKYQDALIAARERAEEMARMKSTILTNISHEIRTPLTSIQGFATILVDEVAEEHKEFIRLIENNSRRLLATLNSVLELARLEGSEPSINPVRFDLVEAARTVVNTLRPVAKSKDVDIDLVVAAETMFIVSDGGSIYSILYNLTGNAAKFTDEGRIEVSLEPAPPDGLVIRVADTGVGIDREFLPRLFDEFSQESEGLTRDYEGTGLGMAITRRAVEALGGDIQVESEKGLGTVFTVRLPIPVED